ncbi:hypothetical protein BJX99DRAFT_255812 [Aspergillus californicus]
MDGPTILHWACSFYGVSPYGLDEASRAHFTTILRYLVEAGCLVNEEAVLRFDNIHTRIQIPMGVLTGIAIDEKFLSEFIDLGALVLNCHMWNYTNVEMFNYSFSRGNEGFLLYDIGNAVMAQSEHDLGDLLAYGKKPGSHALRISLGWLTYFARGLPRHNVRATAFCLMASNTVESTGFY